MADKIWTTTVRAPKKIEETGAANGDAAHTNGNGDGQHLDMDEALDGLVDAPTLKKIDTEYTGDSISQLEGLEAVRFRPAMYIGDTGVPGLHHLFKEIIDNSIDEVLAGHCNTVSVTLGKDNTISVEDNGRGIPVDINTKSGKPGVELAMTELHAGGKFGDGGYKTSGGLHGVGASCVNALSTWMETTVKRGGKIHRIRFERGKVKKKLFIVGECDPKETGTHQRWLADDTIFTSAVNEEGQLAYSSERFMARIRELSYLNKEVAITFHDDLHDAEPETFHHKRGIAEYVAHLNEAKDSLHPKVVYFYREREYRPGETASIEIALQYNKGFQETIYSFANNINTQDGGTHLSGFKTALTRVVNAYARKNNFIKEKDPNFTGDDVREGLTAVISVRISNPQFEGQTKNKLGNPEIEGICNSIVGEGLMEFLDENPQVGRAIMDKAFTASKAREAARRAADLVKRQSALDGNNMPGKLADCSDKDPKKCELYIVEGDSAGGCFSSDTLVALADGRNLSFHDLISEQSSGREHFVYTIRRDGTVGLERAINARVTKRNAKVVRVTLDNGEAIRCTPDHKFMLRDGSYKPAAELTPNDSLMPLYPPVWDIKASTLEEDADAERYAAFVEAIEETMDVYDLEVPGTHNFALAGGVFVHNSAKQGRDRRTQAVLPLRGKIICVEKARVDKALDNESVKSLITAIGTGLAFGIGEDEDDRNRFDMARLRYDKIIIMADADVDGDHIRTLLLNFFYRYMKPLVDEGHIYIAQPPLYSLRIGKDEKRYAKTEADRDRIVKESKRKDIHITRFKGLGEMNPEDLADTTMNPEQRTLALVTVEEAAEADLMFSVLLGEKVEPRRAFIEKYALDVKEIDAF